MTRNSRKPGYGTHSDTVAEGNIKTRGGAYKNKIFDSLKPVVFEDTIGSSRS